MDEDKVLAIFAGCLILFFVGLALLQPYFEAKTFNSCTHSNASYFDAMFTQLRAFDCKK